MRLRDMKYIGFKHQRENKQNSDKYIYILSVTCHSINRQHKNTFQKKCVKAGIVVKEGYIYNTCALSKHIGNMCMRLRNAGKGEASPSLFPRFAPNTHIYLYASTVHMYCIYPEILNRK